MAYITESNKKFAFSTVMEPVFTEIVTAPAVARKITLDSLRISNIEQEGPTKEYKGGLENSSILKYGKTYTLTMEDAIFSANALALFFGADIDATSTKIDFKNEFKNIRFSVVGKTYVIDEDSGERKTVNIVIHEFLPNQILNLSMEAEGDFAVMNIEGEMYPNADGEVFKVVDI